MICNSTARFVLPAGNATARHRASVALSRLQFVFAIAAIFLVEHRVSAQPTSSFQPQSSWSPLTGQSPANNEAQHSGLLAPRKAPSGSSWLSPPTSAGGFAPVQAQSPAFITPEPMNVHGQDFINLDELQPPAPPEVRVAGLTENAMAPLNQPVPEPQGKLPPGARAGVFQKIYLNGTWLPVMEDEPDALGFTDFDTGVVLGFPFTRRDTPLLVTPQFGMHFLENAGALDIPSTLYETAVEFRHLRKFAGTPWAMDAAVAVGYYSDFDQSSSDAVRVTGRGLAVYEGTSGAKWIMGVVYVNRADLQVIPVVGLMYEPTPTTRLDLIIPRPRFSWQTAGSTPGDERWLYVGGEFGGGIWSVTRPSTGELDVISYSDWRVLVGYERKILGGLSWRAETGYVFNRDLDYDSATPDVSLDDTVFVRAGVTY